MNTKLKGLACLPQTQTNTMHSFHVYEKKCKPTRRQAHTLSNCRAAKQTSLRTRRMGYWRSESDEQLGTEDPSREQSEVAGLQTPGGL